MVDDLSGNAGASLASLCEGGLQACIYVLARRSAPKKAQIATYGAELVEVPGPRDASTKAAAAASRMVKSIKYASHAWHPAFLLGQMTTAWEIWEQLGRRVPDWFVAPVGHGGSLLGTWRGFQHLFDSGVTDRLPKLMAVQAEPYTPVYDAFRSGQDMITATPRMAHIRADGIAISAPVRARALLDALYRSHGTAAAVSESEVDDCHKRMAAQGLFVEPTSATVAAAIEKSRSCSVPARSLSPRLPVTAFKNPPLMDE